MHPSHYRTNGRTFRTAAVFIYLLSFHELDGANSVSRELIFVLLDS